MTAIFISHSSADNEAAEEMKAWLEEQGHTSLFLGFDAESGIRVGADWEQTLYRNLRQCQAVIALLTPNWLASKWCFAEVVQARERGKAIFPVKVQPCDSGSVFRDVQQLDLTEDAGEGYRRLGLGLVERGLDPSDAFDWDPERRPYPGLEAFKEADAAIFFGRGEEILNGLEILDSLRRRGRDAPRFVLLLGASGSGKSSLVRAGLIPRLKKTRSEWLPVAPFRPQGDPLYELACALADEFKNLGHPRDRDELTQILTTAAGQDPADGDALLKLARELSAAGDEREATVVLTIDQAEELFGYSKPESARQFLRLLRSALEASDQQLMAIATMRSDFLGEFQIHRALQDPSYDHDFAYQAVPVDPMPERHFVEIIRGPAELVGLRLEEGLVETMVRDTGTRDALPLLAFTLRRLYERFSDDGLLEIREYEELGRLEGAIRAEADRVLRDASPSAEELNALRAAFVPTMVRINADGGYARRRAYTDEMPQSAHTLLRRFTDARLLVSDRDQEGRETLEVSHEALLRTWPQLTTWLADDQDNLRLLESLHRAASDWAEAQQPEDLLVHRGGRLRDAEALVSNRRFALSEGGLDKRYLDACLKAQRTREAVEAAALVEKQAQAEKRARQQRVIAALLTTFALFVAGASAWVVVQTRAVSRQTSLVLATASEVETNAHRFDRALRLAILASRHSLLSPAADEAETQLARAAQATRALSKLPDHAGKVHGAVFADGVATVVTHHSDGAEIWEVGVATERGRLEFEGGIRGAISAQTAGRILAWGEKEVRVWETSSGREVAKFEAAGLVAGGTFSSDGARALVWWGDTRGGGDAEGAALAWDIDSNQQVASLSFVRPQTGPVPERRIEGAVFSDDSSRVLLRFSELVNQTGGWVGGQPRTRDGYAYIWELAPPPREPEAPQPGLARISAEFSSGDEEFAGGDFSDKNTWVLLWSSNEASLWDRSTGKALAKFEHEEIVGASLFEDDSRILTWGDDGTARVWDAASGREVARLEHDDSVRGAVFSKEEARLLTWSADGTARVWANASWAKAEQAGALDGYADAPGRRLERARTDDYHEVASLLHPSGVRGAMFFQDDAMILTWSDSGAAHIWDVTSAKDFERRFWGGRGGGETDAEVAMGLVAEVGRFRHDEAGGAMAGAVLSKDETLALTWGEDSEAHVSRAVSMARIRAPVGALGSNGTVVLWDKDSAHVLDAATRREIATLRHDGSLHTAAVFGEGSKVLTSGEDGTARIWSAVSGEELIRFVHDNEHSPIGAAISADEQRVFSWAERAAWTWDAASGKQLASFQQNNDVGFSFSGGSRVLTWSRDDPTVRTWDAGSGQEIMRFDHEGDERLGGAVISKNDERVVTWASENVWVWDAASGKQLARVQHGPRVNGAAMLRGGNRVLTWGDDSTVRIWDVGSGGEVLRFAHDKSDFYGAKGAVLFSEGARILTWAGDHTARIWEADTGHELARFHHPDYIDGVAMLTWDKELLSWATEARLWDARYAVLRGDQLIDTACSERLSPASQSLRHVTPGDARVAPILRERIGEDVCEP